MRHVTLPHPIQIVTASQREKMADPSAECTYATQVCSLKIGQVFITVANIEFLDAKYLYSVKFTLPLLSEGCRLDVVITDEKTKNKKRVVK